MNEVAQFVSAMEKGDPETAASFFSLVYDELRKLAASQMIHEAPGNTLGATALVHEAFLRLAGGQQFENKAHFFAAAAETMRRILIDSARKKGRQKHGGGRVRIELLDNARLLSEDPDFVLALNEMLDQLGCEDFEAQQIAKLHLFGGLSVEDAGQVLGFSRAGAYRNWKYARAWLRVALEK